MLRSVLFIFCLLNFSNISFANDVPKKAPGKFVLSPGVSYQGQYFAELCVTHMREWPEPGKPLSGWIMTGRKIGAELNFDKDQFIYAPKVGFEIAFVLFAVRGNFIGYIDDGKLDLRFLPEIGLTVGGYVYLTYGYGIPLMDYEIETINRSRFSLTVNLDLGFWGIVNDPKY